MTPHRPELERNLLAQKAWRELCQGSGDPKEVVTRFCDAHPGIVPECFRGDDDMDPLEHKWRRRKGIELVYGKPQSGKRLGGLIGRLRVLAGEPLEHRVIHFRDIDAPSTLNSSDQLLQSLRYCTLAQFSVETVNEIVKVLESILPDLCFFVLERGGMELHIHFLCKPGASTLGSRVRIVADDNLVTLAGYLGKRPLFTPENAAGYLMVRWAQDGRVATRHLGLGLSAKRTRIGLAEVEMILGRCPSSDSLYLTHPARIEILAKPAHPARSEISDPSEQGEPARSKAA